MDVTKLPIILDHPPMSDVKLSYEQHELSIGRKNSMNAMENKTISLGWILF